MTSAGHSSIQECTDLKSYISDSCKYYYLPLFYESLFNSTEAAALGANNYKNRTRAEVRESLLKAQKGRYSHIKIPFDRVGDEMIDWTITQAVMRSFKVVLQVPSRFLFDNVFFSSLAEMSGELTVEWIHDSNDNRVIERLSTLSGHFQETHLSVIVHKQTNWTELLIPAILRQYKSIHLYFSYQLYAEDPFLNCKESHKVVGMLRKKFPGVSFLPPKGVDLWDRRARHDFDMEPFVLPCFEAQSRNPKIRFSVIIPTYNNQNHLRVVLKHLYGQNVGVDIFEVIIVDDGGTDQTQRLVLELLESFPETMNIKYIFFPRGRQRVMGDSQYRAGISRNLGVKNSVGDILCFLDSDIIVPSRYLEKVEEALKTWDAVQARRINLSRQASSLGFLYDAVDESKQCIPDEPYWEKFIKTDAWHELPYSWKYVCTHSFSLRKDLFWKVGGLKKNYIFYGFEDTDLGYRLVKSGYKLHLLPVRVYHMFHENTRSEFMNMKSLRHNLLSRTAQIFYLHHLDEDIFENLLGFMEPEPTLYRLFSRFCETLSFQFLWKSKPNVYKTLSEVKFESSEH